MALEDMDKKYRISDIARELQVSPQEVLRFVKQEGPGLPLHPPWWTRKCMA